MTGVVVLLDVVGDTPQCLVPLFVPSESSSPAPPDSLSGVWLSAPVGAGSPAEASATAPLILSSFLDRRDQRPLCIGTKTLHRIYLGLFFLPWG